MDSPQPQTTTRRPIIRLIVKRPVPAPQPRIRLIVKRPAINPSFPTASSQPPPGQAITHPIKTSTPHRTSLTLPAPEPEHINRLAKLLSPRYSLTGLHARLPSGRRYHIRRTFPSAEAYYHFRTLFPSDEAYAMYAPLAFPKSYTHWVRLVLRLSRLAPDAASIYEARNSGTKGGKKEAKRLRAKRYEYQRFLEGSARVGLAQLAGLRRELVDDVVCEVLGDWGCEWGMWCEEYGLGGLRCRVGGRGRRGLGREMVRVCNEVLDECWYAC